MSLFNAFGQGGFAAFSQTLENIGNIVAPVAPADADDSFTLQPEEDKDEDDDRTTFDSKIQNFFSSMRDSMSNGETIHEKEVEPGSPGSFVSVELSDDSPRSVDSKGSRVKALFDNRTSGSNSFGVVSGVELDKKVHQKYREQLEGEIANLEHKYAELQRSTSKRIQFLEQECKQWKQLAEEGGGVNNLSDATDREEEISTLYEKLGSLTNELELKEEELAAAQETILTLNSESLSSNLSFVGTQTELHAQYETTRQELERLDAENRQLSDQLEEANETIRKLSEESARASDETRQSEEQLIALTNQLRASNKNISSLEQTVADLQSELSLAQAAVAHSTESLQETIPFFEVTHQAVQDRLQELQQLQQQLDVLTKAAEDKSNEISALRQEVIEMRNANQQLSEQVKYLHSENITVQTSFDTTSMELQGASAKLRECVQELADTQRAFSQGQEALSAVHDEHSAELCQLRGQYEQDLAATELRREEVEAERNGARAEVAILSSSVAQLQEKFQDISATLESERAELHDVRSQLDVRMQDTEQLQEELQTCQVALSQAGADVENLNALLRSLQEEMSSRKDSLLTATNASSTSDADDPIESNPTSSVPSKVPTTVAVTTTVAATEEALAAAQADFQKAVKKVKALNKQLKEKEVEAVRLKEEAVSARDEVAAATRRESDLQEALRSALGSAMAEGSAGAGVDQSKAEQGVVLLQEQLECSLAALSSSEERAAALDAQLTATEKALLEAEETARQHAAEASELRSALEADQAKLKEVLLAQDHLQSQLVLCQGDLQAAQARVAELDAALTSSEDTLKSTEETAWQCKAEASELLFALETEQSKLKEALLARDDLETQVAHLQAEQRRMPLRMRSESTDSILSLSEADKSSRTDAGLPPAGPEDALMVAQNNYNKAIRKIKAVNKQLKDKDAEVKKGAQRLSELTATVACLELQLFESSAEVTELKLALSAKDLVASSAATAAQEEKVQQLQDIIREVSNERAEALDKVSNLEATVQGLAAKLGESTISMQETEATANHLHGQLAQCQGDLQAAQARVAELDAALTSSEDTLKSTEETAWQCKAEASELLFALETEQSKLKEALLARDGLQDKLALTQAELSRVASESKAACLLIPDIELVREQMCAVYSSVVAASNMLKFLDAQSVSPDSSETAEHASTFHHLLNDLSTDLLSPLSMLAMASKSLPSLSEQIMSQLKEQSEALGVLRTQEQRARAALARCMDAAEALRVQMPSSASAPGSNILSAQQNGDAATLAERLVVILDTLAVPLQNMLESASANSSEVSRLAEYIEASSAQFTAERDQWRSEQLALSQQTEQTTAQVYSLQAELAAACVSLESCQQKHAQEKQRLLAEVNATQSNASQSSEQLQSLRMQVQKLETENKQLHQVIAQLRQVRKVNKGESDNAISERDELRNQCSALQAQVAALEQQLSYFSATEDTVQQLREELGQVCAALAAAERNLEATRRAVAQLEKDLYDKESELEVTRSDILLVRQELDRRQVEVSNLNDAIHQVETERAHSVARLQKELAEKVEAARKIAECGQDQALSELRQQVEEERGKRMKLEEASQDHELFHRKAELDFIREKKKMQRTLENALAQLNNSQQQVIDRMLVANLIVSYFKRRRSVEVLKIIAKVLAFDDEQLIAVGLKVPPIDIFGAILSTVIGKPAPPPDVEGDNLAEQWINFLINESDQDASNSAGLVGRSRSNSSSSHSGGGSAPPSPLGNAKMPLDLK